jgi:hypothetical protein
MLKNIRREEKKVSLIKCVDALDDVKRWLSISKVFSDVIDKCCVFRITLSAMRM